MLDDMLALIGKLGWIEYIGMQCTSYDRLMIEFLSSSNVNWNGAFRGPEVEISFCMFNVDHRMNLRMFNEFLKFSVVDGAYRDVPSLWRPDPIWNSVTWSKRKAYVDQFGRPRVFDPR